MNNADFTELVNKRLEAIKETLVKKGIEYSTEIDRLDNFKKGAIKSNSHIIDVWKGYKLKHEVSLDEIYDKFKITGKINNNLFSEKITDEIAYLLIGECIMMEEQVNTKNLINSLK